MDYPPWFTPIAILPCMEIGCDKQIVVGAVDEDYLEESHDSIPALDADFVEGDNWLHDKNQKDHPPYLPDHAVVISTLILRSGDRKKIAKTLGHEFAEVIAESAGMVYDTAHAEVANPVENEIAKEIEEGNMPDKSVEKAMDHPDKLGAGADKREHLSPEHKREAVMGEFDKGTLHSGSGDKVTNPKQAVAIAYSESEKKKSSPEDREKVYKKHPYLRPKSDAK